ncbi:hypothetical protein FWH30_02630, partial [Microgenomates group bacterium]|nr:hypothetical protein [Microgenomates group bacterium]
HPLFLKYTFGGTPDIRVIVYNSIPVMAMLRLPTKQSGGRANLHQGALGLGIDLATGVTIHAITGGGQNISYVPGTKKKLNGLMVPFWGQVLKTAVEAANAAALAYGGIDLFVHKEKGPMVVEVNVRPGLSIQLANQQGLKGRLERIKGLNVLSAEHGVKIAQTLFDSHLRNKVVAADEKVLIKPQLEIMIYDQHKTAQKIMAQVATGRQKSIIAAETAEQLGLVNPDDLLWWTKESGGEKAPVIAVALNVARKKITTTLVVSKTLNRDKIKIKLGRDDLKQFLIEME